MESVKISSGSTPTGALSGTREPLPLAVLVVLVHGVLAFAVWLLLFVSKWFPYGPLTGVRDWLYLFF